MAQVFHKCQKHLHFETTSDTSKSRPFAPCSLPTSQEFFVHQHGQTPWGFACNPAQSVGMAAFEAFGKWSEGCDRKHWKTIEIHSVASEDVRQGFHTPPPMPHFVVTAPAEGHLRQRRRNSSSLQHPLGSWIPGSSSQSSLNLQTTPRRPSPKLFLTLPTVSDPLPSWR